MLAGVAKQSKEEQQVHVARRKDAALAPSTGSAMFTGEVSRAVLSDPATAKQLFLGLVRFSAGARTVWHTHTFEQGLVIVEGRGIVATEAGEHLVEAGDVVIVPANEKHWHGATLTTAMAHVAINGPGETTPLEPVTEVRTPSP